MSKENVAEKMAKLEKAIESDKKELKALEEKYTFKGLYKAVAGRKNILTELRDNKEMKEVEKFDSAKEVLVNFVENL